MRIPAGTTLGDYEVLSLIGSGGMGEVYRARDLRLRREVAIKVINASLSGDADAVARFRREAEAASALNHPNIVTVHGFGEAKLPDGTNASYMVVELIEGPTMRELLNDRAVPRRDLLRYCAQAAEGLSKAHAAGIVHRDLKPDNIMVTPDGYAKILDFGLAKLHEKPSSSADEATEKLQAQSGAVIGTIGYIAPEQVRGRAADTRSDIFALGCILYEAVTGRRAFQADSQFDVLSKIVYEDPPPISGAPPELTRLVLRCLDKKPDERYQSARDLAHDLRELEGARTSRPHSADVPSALRVAMIAAVVIIAAVAFLVWRRAPSKLVPMQSIVVLPFTNNSRDPNLDYLSDGITDALLNDVSRATRIRVIARTTAFRYRNTSKDLPAIGRELGVDGIIAGQVRRSGEQLLVDAELVDAKDGTRLWGRHYERNATDMLAVEREMLGELAGVLGGKSTQPATENRVAYDLYLKGRYFWNKRTAESVTKALALFQQAIDADPTYARAYSGVADCYIAFNQLGGAQHEQACIRGEAAAHRALELDESIAEAHTSLGYLDLSCELDLKAADRELRRALELSPNYAQAQHWYGLYLTNLGRAKEALPHVREAARLDPFSTQIAANLAYATFYTGQVQEAVKLANDAIELDRNAPYPYHMRGYIALASGDYPTAIRYLQMAIDKKLMVSMPFLAYTYARAGDAAAARRTLAAIDASDSDAARTPALKAGTLAALGERDAAMASLERAWNERDFWLSELHISPPFDPLREDPRFIEFVKRVDAR